VLKRASIPGLLRWPVPLSLPQVEAIPLHRQTALENESPIPEARDLSTSPVVEYVPSTEVVAHAPVSVDQGQSHDTALGKYVLLEQLVIDPHQPRQYLPTDLRDQVTHRTMDPRIVMQTLMERAASGDAVAAGYLVHIQELAHTIQRVGLQQPLRVSEEHDRDHQTIFRIVDGERRYWAHMWMAVVGAATDSAAHRLMIPVILHRADASADDIQRAQWAANLHREDIPAVDFAEIIWQVREDVFARLAIDRQRYVHALGAAAQGLTLKDIAALLTCQEAERLTGRQLKRSSLYLYLAVAEQLKAVPKALARAHGLSLRQLHGLVRLSESQQTEAVLRMIASSQADVPTRSRPDPRSGAPGQPGRPTSLQRSVNMCINLASALQKLSNKALLRHTPEDQQVLLSELDAASAEIDRARKLIKTRLSS
jgi:ParB-like nuclease domain